ncbi:MAG: tRNA (adenosine(37)-N6)-threonylcarbamoyltransferase complex ATPase subunit type 1 TsaE [Candidatus Nomurabacteria bacterium]
MKKEFTNIKLEDLNKVATEVENLISVFLKKENRACVVFLNGDLGVGKTTFVKSLGEKLGIKEVVISPTFILRKDYGNLIHIDGYRFDNPGEGAVLELERELEEKNKIIIIEWPEKFVSHYGLNPDISIDFKYINEDERNIFLNIL